MPSSLHALARLLVLDNPRGTKRLNFSQFRELYRAMEQVARDESVTIEQTEILLLTETTLVRFSTAPHFILRVSAKRPLRKADFDIVLSPHFKGNVDPIPIRAFVWTEIRLSWWILFPVFFFFWYFLGRSSDYSGLQAINQMLVEANALFVGIFVLFTISQNRELLATPQHVKQGTTHQLMQNDRYIAWLSIISLVLAFVSAALAGTAVTGDPLLIPIFDREVQAGEIARFLTAFSLVLLVDALLAVTRYYLRLMRTAVEGEMFRHIMGKASVEDAEDED